MFVMTAVLLYIGVALLARVRPYIHVPPAEAEEGVSPYQSDDNTEVEEAGEGSDAQFRSRSRSRENTYDDHPRQLATVLSITEE
jgi:hypothetical protein